MHGGPPSETHTDHCGLCARVVGADHPHLLDTQQRTLVCSCHACATLFESKQLPDQQFRLVPQDIYVLRDVAFTDLMWTSLSIPVDLAFLYFDTVANRVVALYPGAMGAAEAQLHDDAWAQLVSANPELGTILPDVQALLVNRTRGAREHWVAPIDLCYALVGLIRLRWRGLSGGEEVWAALDKFLAGVRNRAVRMPRGVVSA